MITGAIMSFFLGMVRVIFSGLLGLVGTPAAWVADGWAAADTVLSWVYAFDAWIPVTLALTVGAAVLAAYFVGLAIVLVRTIISYLTFGGGTT